MVSKPFREEREMDGALGESGTKRRAEPYLVDIGFDNWRARHDHETAGRRSEPASDVREAGVVPGDAAGLAGTFMTWRTGGTPRMVAMEA